MWLPSILVAKKFISTSTCTNKETSRTSKILVLVLVKADKHKPIYGKVSYLIISKYYPYINVQVETPQREKPFQGATFINYATKIGTSQNNYYNSIPSGDCKKAT